jgi:hypothetical protein
MQLSTLYYGFWSVAQLLYSSFVQYAIAFFAVLIAFLAIKKCVKIKSCNKSAAALLLNFICVSVLLFSYVEKS